MRGLLEQDILNIWEMGLRQHPVERAITMQALAGIQYSYNDVLATSVGQRDAFLLALREATFGSQFAGFAQCARCQERLEFTFEAGDVRAAPLEAVQQLQPLRIEDYEVHLRLPTSADMLAAARCPDVAAARNLLISRCVPQAFLHGEEIAAELLPESVLDGAGAQIIERDPQIEVDIVLRCPACGEQWAATFDIVAFLWSEILTHAKRLLRDVHTLALAYCWHESDILAMSAVRRQFYLEMVF